MNIQVRTKKIEDRIEAHNLREGKLYVSKYGNKFIEPKGFDEDRDTVIQITRKG